MIHNNIVDWIALQLVPGVGARMAQKLLQQWNSPAEIFKASPGELKAAGLQEESWQAIITAKVRDLADKQFQQLTALNAIAIAFNDPRYPSLLKEIYDPPIVIYTKGQWEAAIQQPTVAIVGSRRCSTYGQHTAELLARELAEQGITVVSGLARGIDTIAHQATLRAQGLTLAVTGSGIDIVYPKENQALAREITKQGAIVTELPLGSPPLPQNFPFRNRIIAGLCLGVVIVEASERSGSLITARLALEQNREVFAVPGNITSANSFGPNYLIKEGAKLVQCCQDILEELPTATKISILTKNSRDVAIQGELFILSEQEQHIYDHINIGEPRHIDELANICRLSAAELASSLFMLEMKDKVKQLPGKQFVKVC